MVDFPGVDGEFEILDKRRSFSKYGAISDTKVKLYTTLYGSTWSGCLISKFLGYELIKW